MGQTLARKWYDEKPELGDLIQIFRGSYEHWAVYVGDGFIVHLAPPCANGLMSVQTKKAIVKKEKLRDVLGTDRWEINNKKYESRSVEVIVREALAKVGERLHYDVLTANCEHFANKLRYGKAESRQPEPGDLIEIFRLTYQHWAVYVGDDFIVHLTSSSDVPGASANSLRSVPTKKAMVKKEKLKDVLGTDRWEISNSMDKMHKPRSVQVIVREALAKVGEELPYDIFTDNCEHFANKLRYRRAKSRQVAKVVLTTIAAGVVAGIPGIAVVAVVGVLRSFFKKK